MTYQETLDYLYNALPMFQRVGAVAYKKNLDNIIRLCDFLGNPQHQYETIHIAGTNGKGSVTHMLGAVCTAAGHKTGIYSSPHLKDFRERIKIGAAYVEEDFVVEFTKGIRSQIEQIQPSFFEITVAMAFQYFAEKQVDVAVIETGMGGRLDSTNIVHPLLSVITNIGWDHMQYLGDTLPAIAFEKAGIIKPGVPVVIGETHPETAPVFTDVALSRQSPIIFADQEIHSTVHSLTIDSLSLQVSGNSPYGITDWQIGTGAAYQQRNVITSLMAIQQLVQLGADLPQEAVIDGLRYFQQHTAFLGRWQVLQAANPMILTDCAHNPNGMELVMDQVKQLPYRQLHIVLGTVSDKKLKPYLATLPTDAMYYFCKPDVPRGLDADMLQKTAGNAGLHGETYPSVSEALIAAQSTAQPDDLIYIGGSIFVVAEVL